MSLANEYHRKRNLPTTCVFIKKKNIFNPFKPLTDGWFNYFNISRESFEGKIHQWQRGRNTYKTYWKEIQQILSGSVLTILKD